MAQPNRTEAFDLERRLEKEPYRFDFYQAVRRLECAYPHMPRVGQSLRPADDPVRFCQNPSMAFPPSTLANYHPATVYGPARLALNFFGMMGPNGPLPLHLTDYARDRLRNHHDPTFSRFLDIFHHRLASLFYRCWAANQPTISFDRPSEDRFSVYVGSLFGIGMEPLLDRDAVNDIAKLHFSGRLACQTHHAEGLRAILADFFHVPAQIIEFFGRWIDLPQDCHCHLGESPQTCSLGATAILGSRIWDCQGQFRVRLGPMKFKDYERLLPDSDSFKRLVAWVRNYVGFELDWDVQLALVSSDVPSLRLGQVGKLGWTTWLSSQPFVRDAYDLVLRPVA